MARGRLSEERAAASLRRRGRRILARNHRCREGEADIICLDGRTLVAVEVKTIPPLWPSAEIARMVPPFKLAKIGRALADFIAKAGDLDYDDIRFDVAAVRHDGTVEFYEGVSQ